ncbi:MAG: hypothetical protein IBX72_08880 [Nitrospirae bacterium]|jgi:hypothetical protein|nr:hypothetical protein [Nitrospirota bacterium]
MRQNPGQRAKGKERAYVLLIALCSVLYILCSAVASYAADNPLENLRDETVSYFKPMTGKIIKAEGNKVVINLGAKDSVKQGMRFNILIEEAPFRHPVTKEPLGHVELLKGKLEIREINSDSSVGEVIQGEAKEGYKVRISEIRVNLIFCQSSAIDWYLAESYYRSLKETGRYNMIDTWLETDDPRVVVEEARKRDADVALLLTARVTDSDTYLKQRLFWVADGIKFFEKDVIIDATLTKELRFGEEYFSPGREEALMKIDLPGGARLIAMGDIDGDKKQEIIISTEKEVRVYTSGVDLQPALGGIKIETSAGNIWLDSIDLNRNGKDEVIITSMKDDAVISYIYELKNSEFTLLYEDNLFLRRLGNKLIAQVYSPAEGYDGKVFGIVYDGEYKKAEEINLPPGVNIYDFVYFEDPLMGKLILAYDHMSLSLYDDKNIKIWRSDTSTGGFLKTFKKSSPTVMLDRGEWIVRDRLLLLGNRNAIFVKRIPLLEMVKGLGYKNSQIKTLWWNGLSMEESVLIDNIKGSVLDYTIEGDKMFVLTAPLFGIKPGNILKGENPLGTRLYIYSIKGI